MIIDPSLTAAQSVGQKTSKGISNVLVLACGILSTGAALIWEGLHHEPAPFPAIGQPAAPQQTIPLPPGLPTPVERFYHTTYGDRVPVITSGVISGRGSMRLGRISLPLRFRFMHTARRAFRAYFELSIFRLPLIKVNERFVDGRFRADRGWLGVDENEPKTDHSAALRMWGEWVTWLPALLLTDPEAHWEPLDDASALLVVPVGSGQERVVVRFDPATSKVQYVEAMKYKHPTDDAKTLWVNAVWFGERPWATFDIEEIVLNLPVDTSLASTGLEWS
jgi:hypothetical protein